MTTPSPVVAKRRPRARKGEGELLRGEIMATTERLLIDTGDEEAVSIRAVADAVGVTPPAIYRHFPDKASLILEVCDRHFDLLDRYMVEQTVGIDDPVEVMRERARAYLRFGRDNPEHYRIMFMTRKSGLRGPTDVSCFAHMTECVQQCIDGGAFRPEFNDALAITMVVWSMVHGLTTLLVTQASLPGAPVEDLLELMLDVQLTGLLAP